MIRRPVLPVPYTADEFVQPSVCFKQRNTLEVEQSLLAIAKSIENGTNLIDPIRAACKKNATLGEICSVLRENMGTWVAPGGI